METDPILRWALDGLDSLLSTVQMPGGVPVATVAIGKAGAVNAAILAVEILALSDGRLKKKLLQHKRDMKSKVDRGNKRIARERSTQE